MSLIFPDLVGIAWPITKTPSFQTRIRRATSGRELRISDFASGATNAPWRVLWQFTVNFDQVLRGEYLESEVARLAGFYNSCCGPFYPFFYSDPDDNEVTAEFIALGDNVTASFQLCRFFGDSVGFTEAITAPRAVSAVYINGVSQSGFTVDQGTGIVTLASAPAAGATITADFTYWFRCRFTDDTLGIEEFFKDFHSTKSLGFVSALGDTTLAPTGFPPGAPG